jgi:hypothetical protein
MLKIKNPLIKLIIYFWIGFFKFIKKWAFWIKFYSFRLYKILFFSKWKLRMKLTNVQKCIISF